MNVGGYKIYTDQTCMYKASQLASWIGSTMYKLCSKCPLVYVVYMAIP